LLLHVNEIFRPDAQAVTGLKISSPHAGEM
jgi:hypothetical protein